MFLAAFSIADGKLHLVFCDVGQGDAILIYRGSSQILVDGGPDASVLPCLSRHMPFWDRKIETTVMTHPDEDHFGGLVEIVRRYGVDLFLTPGVGKDGEGFKVLKEDIEEKKIRVMSLRDGDILRNGLLQIETLWPSEEWLADKVDVGNGGNGVLGAAVGKPNKFSIVQRLSYGEFNALLTGDIEPPVTEMIAEGYRGYEGVKGVEVLKVPHHGSKNGLTQRLLDATRPELAVISVGKKNRYGHPHKETIKLLSNSAIKLLRTDLDGEIEVVTNGKRWWVKE